MKAYRRRRIIGPLILNSGSRERREFNSTPQPPYPWGRYFRYTSNRMHGPQSWLRLLENWVGWDFWRKEKILASARTWTPGCPICIFFIFVVSIPLCYINYRSYILSNTTHWILIPLIHTFIQATCFGYVIAIIRPTWTVELALDTALQVWALVVRIYC
jgi:hypothetical protein